MKAFEHFERTLDAEAAAERKAAREASKLEPITIVIADQEELRRIHELAKRRHGNAVAMIRCHLRGWSREQLDSLRIEQRIA